MYFFQVNRESIEFSSSTSEKILRLPKKIKKNPDSSQNPFSKSGASLLPVCSFLFFCKNLKIRITNKN